MSGMNSNGREAPTLLKSVYQERVPDEARVGVKLRSEVIIIRRR